MAKFVKENDNRQDEKKWDNVSDHPAAQRGETPKNIKIHYTPRPATLAPAPNTAS
jgi:hypothetical protein